jgi:uncharacterized membrane protein HdeD (DUF308 family)
LTWAKAGWTIGEQRAVGTTVDGWLRAVLFLVGVLILVAGVVCLRNPFVSLLSLVILISLAWMIDGVGQLIAAGSPTVSRARWLYVLSGLVLIAGAMVILFWPELALLTFTVLGGWLLVIFGVMTAGSALRERGRVTHSEPMRAGDSKRLPLRSITKPARGSANTPSQPAARCVG